MAERLSHAVRKQDTVARMGGDEFVLLLADIGKTDAQAHEFSQNIIQHILGIIYKPVQFKDYQYQCSASIGICLFKDDQLSADELLRRADSAMYLAKKQGRNNFKYYDASMQPKYDSQLQLQQDLSQALVENQFEIYLQGQFDENLDLIGAEILLRWHHPKHGLIFPADFIPFAEESGLIVPIGNWVMQQACDLLNRWQTATHTQHLAISVNVSAIQFNHPDFISQVELAIKSSACQAKLLCLELTESTVVQSIEETMHKMNLLKTMGLSIAIDDFGTGYSSLSILKRLPITELKIDQSFVQDITKSEAEATIVQTILQMGKNLKLRIVAEGVETEAQLSYLKNYGCKIFQGYFFQRPCTIENFEKVLPQTSVNLPAKSPLIEETFVKVTEKSSRKTVKKLAAKHV